MRVTICGSVAFINEMTKVAAELLSFGHEVKMPLSAKEGKGSDYWDGLLQTDKHKFASMKRDRMLEHFEKIKWCDAILVLNYDKLGKSNYIGPNTFLEMGCAMTFGKKIFLLNKISGDSPFYEELIGIGGIIINEDLMKIV